MKNIKFIGDPLNDGHGPSQIVFFGETFHKGHFTKTSDEVVIAKAEASSHFEVEAVKPGRPPKVKHGSDSE